MVTKVAKRYASALFQEALGRKVLEDIARDMLMLSDSIRNSRELEFFLKSQIISGKKKGEVLSVLFTDAVQPLTNDLITLLLDKRREAHLYAIALWYNTLYKKEKGLIDAEVYVVYLPGEDQKNALRLSLEKRTGKKVSLTFIEDPDLKGGMAIRIDDTVIDGSVRHKLQQLEWAFQQDGMSVS